MLGLQSSLKTSAPIATLNIELHIILTFFFGGGTLSREDLILARIMYSEIVLKKKTHTHNPTWNPISSKIIFKSKAEINVFFSAKKGIHYQQTCPVRNVKIILNSKKKHIKSINSKCYPLPNAHTDTGLSTECCRGMNSLL